MPSLYRKKPVVIEAVRFDGEIQSIDDFLPYDKRDYRPGFRMPNASAPPSVTIKTLEGDMKAQVGDYIIKGVNGEFYPCKPDIFAKTYEQVEPDEVMRNPEQFEELGFNLADEFDFGLAICAIKQGKKVARKGWNGAGMFVYYTPAGCFPNKHLAKVKVDFPDDIVPYREFLALKTAQGDVAVWTPSTSDALAEDWMLVE